MTVPMHERLALALQERYRVERRPDGSPALLGRGGTATVFLAHDLRHDRPVALKVVHPELAASVGTERFLREIRTVARLSHPHILPLFDSGEADGLLYYVMPHVPGESLRRRLEREGRLTVSSAVRIACQVGLALDHAHRHGVVHRDIKPETILLDGDQAVVADFGIATAREAANDERLTEAGLAVVVLERANGARVSDAEVRYASDEELTRVWDRARSWVGTLEENLTSVGRSVRTDAHGEARIAPSSRPATVCARKGGLWNYRAVPVHGEGTLSIELVTDRELELRVVDRSSKPVSGVPVALLSTSPQGFTVPIWQERTSDGGIAKVRHVDARRGREVDAPGVAPCGQLAHHAVEGRPIGGIDDNRGGAAPHPTGCTRLRSQRLHAVVERRKSRSLKDARAPCGRMGELLEERGGHEVEGRDAQDRGVQEALRRRHAPLRLKEREHGRRHPHHLRMNSTSAPRRNPP